MNNRNYEKPLAELICFDLAAVRMDVGLDSKHIRKPKRAAKQISAIWTKKGAD